MSVVEPEHLKCRIVHTMYRDPAFVPESGNTFEREAILKFWKSCHAPREPLTDTALSSTALQTNWGIRREVQQFLDDHPGYVPDNWPDRDITSVQAVDLMKRLRAVWPNVLQEDYQNADGTLDLQDLQDDVDICQSTYASAALDEVLRPMAQEICSITDERLRTALAEVVPGRLVLGTSESARDLSLLRRLGVRRVVNCSPQTVKTGQSFYAGDESADDMEYMELWQDDYPDYSILDDFEIVWSFASQKGGAVFIHCEQGVNRGAAIAIAYYLRLSESHAEKKNLSPDSRFLSCWRDVAEMKGKVLTNLGFQRQLLIFARHGNNCDTALDNAWRTPKDRQIARFRELAVAVGWTVIGPDRVIPATQKWPIIVHIRDGTIRAEQRMAQETKREAFNDDEMIWVQRIKKYALRRCADAHTKAKESKDGDDEAFKMQAPASKRARRSS